LGGDTARTRAEAAAAGLAPAACIQHFVW